ncbi:MAG: T9SS type A sorting domain-containing protein [Bernardetiaceae bacterium]
MNHQQLRRLFLGLLLFFACTFGAYAQETLPTPDALRSGRTEGGFNGGGPAPGTVLYGAVPPGGENAPVLLFIHGYSSSAATWYGSNTMYANAYNSGYRTAFVSVYPDRNSWENGQLFKTMIETVSAAYNVPKVIVIAHSKGGVDTDAALVHYGAYNKVDRVITLGTPHFGTPLADLAQSDWVNWLSAVFGQFNDATAQLQVGTMSYFRSITDNAPNNQFTDFRVVGGTRYYGALWVPGWYLSFTERRNDGVVTYSSTQRPNSFSMPSQPLNHSDIAAGSSMWNNILPQLPGSNMRAPELPQTPTRVNPNAIVKSRTQILTTDRGSQTFTIPANATEVTIEVRQRSEGGDLRLTKANSDARIAPIADNIRIEDRFWGGYLTGYQLRNPEAGTYQLTADGPFVAMVTYAEGVAAVLRSDLNDEKLVYALGEPIHLRLDLEEMPEGETVRVTGFWKRNADLRGTLEEGETEVIRFQANGSTFTHTVPAPTQSGVYHLSVQVEGQTFSRSLVTSVAVVPDGQGQGNDLDRVPAGFAMQNIFPNPSNGTATIQLSLQTPDRYTMRIFDMSGRVVDEQVLGSYIAGQHQMEWTAPASLRNGMYIVEISNSTERQTKRLILLR